MFNIGHVPMFPRVCFGRNRAAASRTACHSSTLVLASGPLREPCHPFIMEQLKMAQCLSAHSDSAASIVRAAISPSLRAKSCRETSFRKNSPI